MNQLDHVKVLVLDDHKNMRLLWRSILLAFGIRNVLEAESGEEAFEMIREDQSIDLMIVDHHLPGLTGAEFVSMLRRAPDSPAPFMPVVACTADTRRTILNQLIDAGVDEVLAKPVSADQAWKKISMVVNKRRKFVRTPFYFGPDRRRRPNPSYTGPERRLADQNSEEVGEVPAFASGR